MNNRHIDPEPKPITPTSFAEPLAANLPVQPVRDAAVRITSPATATGSNPINPTTTPSLMEQALQSRLAILATLFGVTGALGLPLLWMSPAFSRLHKWVWSIIVVAYTSALIGATWAIMVWAYRQFR